MTSLVGENFNSTLNSSTILAHSAFFALKAQKLNDVGHIAALVNNEQIANYFMSSTGFVNDIQFIESSKISTADVRNYMLIIEYLIKHHFDVNNVKPN
jgi:hypothetical protein